MGLEKKRKPQVLFRTQQTNEDVLAENSQTGPLQRLKTECLCLCLSKNHSLNEPHSLDKSESPL